MPRFTSESLEALRQKIDLVDVVSTHVSMKRMGTSYKGLCPFHDEKTPSFVVHQGDHHYHCFGCGAHGDAIQFLMQHLKLRFSDAVLNLAEKFHVPLEESNGKDQEVSLNRGRLKEVLEIASQFYHFFLLHTEEGKEALTYLYNRGFSLPFIRQFRLGFAPRQEGILKKYLHELKVSDQDMLDAGLLSERNGKLKEFFLERITFPIQEATGSVIGFSARKFKESTFGGKYINSPETLLFKKSKVLFGLNFCRKRIAKERLAIIVEGQLDALRLIFNGFNIAVAGLGTAFGQAHAKELLLLGIRRVYVLFDADRAGIEAALKVGDIFQKEGVEALIVSLPDQADPDEILLQKGPLAISQAILYAKDYLTFLFQTRSKEVSLHSPAEKNYLLQDICKRIREWNNPVIVHESLKKLAHLAQVPEDLLGVGLITSQDVFVRPSMRLPLQAEALDPDKILEADLVRWLFLLGKEDEKIHKLCALNITQSDFKVPIAWKVFTLLMQMRAENKEVDLIQLSIMIDDPELDSFLCLLMTKKVNKEKAEVHLAETIQRLKERNWMLAREDLKVRIHRGEGNEEEVLSLVRRFDELKKNPPQVVF